MIHALKYLLLTLLVEMPVVIIAYHKQWKTMLVTGVLLNLFTWPLVTVLYNYTSIRLLYAEIGACIVEAIGFRIFLNGSWLKAFSVSFIANTASFFIGMKLSSIKIVL